MSETVPVNRLELVIEKIKNTVESTINKIKGIKPTFEVMVGPPRIFALQCPEYKALYAAKLKYDAARRALPDQIT